MQLTETVASRLTLEIAILACKYGYTLYNVIKKVSIGQWPMSKIRFRKIPGMNYQVGPSPKEGLEYTQQQYAFIQDSSSK